MLVDRFLNFSRLTGLKWNGKNRCSVKVLVNLTQKRCGMYLFSLPGGTEWLLIFFGILLLFGGRKIPELMKGIGRGIREFNSAKDKVRDSLDEGMKEDQKQQQENQQQTNNKDSQQPSSQQKTSEQPHT